MNEQVQDGQMGTGPMNNGTGTQLRYEFRLERYGTPTYLKTSVYDTKGSWKQCCGSGSVCFWVSRIRIR